MIALVGLSVWMGLAGLNTVNLGFWIDPSAAGGARTEALRNYLLALSVPLGAGAIAMTLVKALRRTAVMQTDAQTKAADARTKRDEVNAQTFARALQLLTSDTLTTRLGAIYALEGLMRADFGDPNSDGHLGRQIGETLAAFARTTDRRSKPDRIENVQLPCPEDVQVAVRVIARSWPVEHRPDLEQESGVDLRGARLSRLQMPQGADLRGFNLSRASLHGAELKRAKLHGAWLAFANLQGARLIEANLQGAHLWHAQLQHAELAGADVRRAVLQDANLQGAVIFRTDLKGAQLNRTQFCGPDGEDPARGLTRDQLAEARWLYFMPPMVPPNLLPLPHDGTGEPLKPEADAEPSAPEGSND